MDMRCDNPSIENLILSNEDDKRLEWIPGWQITDIEPTQVDNVYYAGGYTLLLLGNGKTCTPTLVSEFARIYSFPTHKHSNDFNHFRRYSKWLYRRNKLITGFTKYNDNYYMVADKLFYHYYSRYGFCAACGLLRCSPVWCICGHKQLCDGWTSNNRQLDELIKKTQLQTNSANHAYLEWIPFDCIGDWGNGYGGLYGLPTLALSTRAKLISLEITDETNDLYYAELCDNHPDILNTDVWITIGFTYNASKRKYCLIKEYHEYGLCRACACELEFKINAFCYWCKAPIPPDWTTGNRSLDSFIMESWNNVKKKNDPYIQWVEYSLLTDVREMTSLRHTANWLDPRADELKQVLLKKIVDGQADQFDFYQLIKEHPEILTPENIWIIGITQEPSTGEYYLVFFYDIHTISDKFIHRVQYMQYDDFYELEEIGSGGYGTIYTSKYKGDNKNVPGIVVLKRFNKMPELLMSEFMNHSKCLSFNFLRLYGVTQAPNTKEYMIVMQFANNGSLWSYLHQNMNSLTWRRKLQHLEDIAYYLKDIHNVELVHCDLHGGNIVMHDNKHKIESFICDLGLSRSVNSPGSAVQGVLPFIAPEVFHTCKFTQKSDIYSFGIIMYLIATGEPPFRDTEFDRILVCDIMGGLRPKMPDSAPEEYKKLAEWCCDADPDKRPDVFSLWPYIYNLGKELDKGNYDDVWNTIYHNNVKPLSRLEKESKYSSKILPTGDLPKPKNSYDLDSAPVTQNVE